MRWVRAKASKPLLRPSPLARQLRIQAVRQARRARWEVLLLAPALAAVLWAYSHREELFGVDLPVRIASVIALVILGWAFARSLGRAVGPVLMRRVEPGTAGTLGFLIRLSALAFAVLMALRVAGFNPQTLAVGGAFTAVIFGLAAQQTLGNLIAGTVLLSARPFRVSDRVRFQAGALGGQIEGVVMSLGLLYTTLSQGEDEIMVPNSMVLRARWCRASPPPSCARASRRGQAKLGAGAAGARGVGAHAARPHIGLEEVEADEVVVRIAATPESGADGPQLADEILAAISRSPRGRAPPALRRRHASPVPGKRAVMHPGHAHAGLHHGHSHAHGRETNRTRLTIALAINLALVVAGVIGTVVFQSIALLADAGHVLSDVGRDRAGDVRRRDGRAARLRPSHLRLLPHGDPWRRSSTG